MNEPLANPRPPLAWQEKWRTPLLLILAIAAVALVWAVGFIPWWLAMTLLFVGGIVLVGAIYRSVAGN